MSLLDELKSRIIALNSSKNTYATKKMKNDTTDTDEKDLVSSLIYVVAELRRCANDMGISDDGKINTEINQQVENFNHLNESVKNLKSQILFLVKSSPEEIKAEMSRQNDIQHVKKKEESEKQKATNNNSEAARKEETKARLLNRLQEMRDNKE